MTRADELRKMVAAATVMLSDGSDAAHSISDSARHAKLVAEGKLRNAAHTIALALADALDLLAKRDAELARLRAAAMPFSLPEESDESIAAFAVEHPDEGGHVIRLRTALTGDTP